MAGSHRERSSDCLLSVLICRSASGRQFRGAAAAGLGAVGLQRGARADLLVVDASDPALADRGPDRLLDVQVFSIPTRPFARVMVGGRWVIGT